VYHYVPPAFDLFEFDDDPVDPGRQPRRWFSSWNGAVNKPAQDVCLGWSAGQSTVLVATSGRALEANWARLSAAHLALGGIALPIPRRPDSAGATQREIQRIASTEQMWSPGFALVADGSRGVVAACDGFTVAHGYVGSELVVIAAVGLDARQFRVRKVMDWRAYGTDGAKRHPLNELYQ
jgi:hypothetical protein